MKKSVVKTIVVILLMTLVLNSSMSAFAFSISTKWEDKLNTFEPAFPIITEDDLFISDEVAFYIAEMFVRDMIATQTTCWNEATKIVSTTIMYDETGENITAYTFELSRGYVVVAARIDLPEIIMEWSDVAAPIYTEFDLGPNDTVVYLGMLDYLVENDEDTLETLDGTIVSKEEVYNYFDEICSIDNVREDLLTDIVESKQAASTRAGEVSLLSNTYGSDITDPFAYASNVYGFSYICSDYANNWESHANFAVMSSFSGYAKHCGPTAITNIIKMHMSKYNRGNRSNINTFTEVIAANTAAGGKYYSSSGGTQNSTANSFIRDSFARFGVTVQVYGRYVPTYVNVKNATTANRLMYLMLLNHELYGDHHIVGYAYTRLQNTSLPTVYKLFVKIADGWSTSARYVDMTSASSFSHTYWEVYFS